MIRFKIKKKDLIYHKIDVEINFDMKIERQIDMIDKVLTDKKTDIN